MTYHQLKQSVVGLFGQGDHWLKTGGIVLK
jgi:hypothetical protein